ncbi:MAG: hypothetical protein EBT03_11020 [Betaproteobacteria bacterium]|nr:hypothetical protein [Betaproteobacteria bacterium]
MQEPEVGELVTISRNGGCHPLRIGDSFIVCHVDRSDDTVRVRAPDSKTVFDFWVPWSDIQAAMFGWRYARVHLPPDIARLLNCCVGIWEIALNTRLKEALVDTLPDWRERALAATGGDGDPNADHDADDDADDDDDDDDDF